MDREARRRAAIRFIVCLGIVSLFADMTYEGARSIIGPFLMEKGATATEVGLIAGFGEMLAAGLRYFSGRFADRTRAYWTITIAGYGVNLIVVPALAFAGNWQMAALLVAIERTGKAIRGPARDVLLSSVTATVGHGWGFGLHAAFDQAGAMVGPLLMAAAVSETHRFGPAFLRLAVPAVLALGSLLAAEWAYPVKGEPPAAEAQVLPRVFWLYVAAAGVLASGFVDFPLLAYHWQKNALVAPAAIPLLYSGAMGVNGIAALVFGRLFDRYGIGVLAAGTAISLAALPLGFLGGFGGAVAASACWAVGMGAQDGSLRSGIAQVVSMTNRGAAFGAFNGVYGVAWFAGSAVMGMAYDHSIAALVGFGMAMQASSAVFFLALAPRLRAAGRAR
ncbi:MAG: MFS transporter [Acidobacteria bacterium]|nr:MFS transporter [Acidobacteriota bacterium]